MKGSKKWEILQDVTADPKKLSPEYLQEILLINRNIKTKEEREAFLHPQLEEVTIQNVGIDQKQLDTACERVQKAIKQKEKIAVFGDYDVDGITGTAILWEALYALGADVIPYIPHRVDEGYGLSRKGIENLLEQEKDVKLIITVDNGIVANDAVTFANEKGVDVIITDHHTVGDQLPDAVAIVHTTKLCGAAVGWMFARALADILHGSLPEDHLSLVALATVADLVPLTGANRILLTYGLKVLRQTKRPGLLALCEEAQIQPENIEVYTIGHLIGPRLNAMGRMESAMDSLRLLCTKDRLRAKVLAEKLGLTNKERQLLTQSLALHAIERVKNQELKIKNLLFIADDSYEEGVIGLVAGKLVEEFYRPAIVIAKGEKHSKASARSVAGFNIIAFIRSASDLLVNAGGHPMAAGFTVETEKILVLQERLEKLAEEQVLEDMLLRILKIDCQLPLEIVTSHLYVGLQNLAPFGMGNPEPLFVSDVVVKDIKTVGADGKHLKLLVKPIQGAKVFSAIAFGKGELFVDIHAGDTIQLAYTVDMNEWHGDKQLQLKVRDIHFPQK